MFVATRTVEPTDPESFGPVSESVQTDRRGQTSRDAIVGESHALRYVMSRIEMVAETDATVLLCGQTGTGKELMAQAIHQRSRRRDKPLVVVNCAALPATLVESELFGRERGAFTGAHAPQAGRFELANRGTIFLDEIGELPLEMQPKLLRVLQGGQVERLGSPRTIDIDVRVIAATNRDLLEEVRQGRFRLDRLLPAERLSDHRALAARSPRRHPAARAPSGGEVLADASASAIDVDSAERHADARVLRLARQHPRARERAPTRHHRVVERRARPA